MREIDDTYLRSLIVARLPNDGDGIAVAATADGATAVWTHGSVNGHPVDNTTLMYGASLAKQIVGLLVAVAVDDHRLQFDARIRDYMPALPAWLRPVQIVHLLHHTAGLPNVTDSIAGIARDNQAVVDRLREAPPTSNPPGTAYAYSNTGYVLLAEALANAYQEPIGSLAARTVFVHLGMTDTRLGGPAAASSRPNPPGTIGDGGLWTTIDDLNTWLTALNRRWPNPRISTRIEERGILNNGDLLDYAWGVRIVETDSGRLISHGGTWSGWLSKTVRRPDQSIAVSVLNSGSTEATISALATDLAADIARAG